MLQYTEIPASGFATKNSRQIDKEYEWLENFSIEVLRKNLSRLFLAFLAGVDKVTGAIRLRPTLTQVLTLRHFSKRAGKERNFSITWVDSARENAAMEYLRCWQKFKIQAVNL